MPSRFADLYAALAVPVLQTHLAEDDETIVRYPLGRIENAADVIGIFNEESAADDQSRGHENVRKASLVIFDTTLDVDTRDFYLVAGETWVTRSIQKGTDPTFTLELERRDMETRNGQGGKTLL